MSLSKTLHLLALVIALAIASVSAYAQGLLGHLLRAPRPAPGMAAGDPNSRTGFQTEFSLQKGQWVAEHQIAGDPNPSRGVCLQELARTAHTILNATPIRPIAARYLDKGVLVFKDAADPDSPMWKIDILSCGKATIPTGTVLNPDVATAFSAYEVDLASIQTQASDFVRQTDGSFPPPPTKAELADAERQKKFLAQMIIYAPNGEMVSGRGDLLFETPQECDHYVSTRLKASAARATAGTVVVGSVLVPGDASGYIWFGCIHPDDVQSDAFDKYVDVTMSLARAKTMQRFPNLSGQSNPPPKPNKQVKF